MDCRRIQQVPVVQDKNWLADTITDIMRVSAMVFRELIKGNTR